MSIHNDQSKLLTSGILYSYTMDFMSFVRGNSPATDKEASNTDFDVSSMWVRISFKKKQSNGRWFETKWRSFDVIVIKDYFAICLSCFALYLRPNYSHLLQCSWWWTAKNTLQVEPINTVFKQVNSLFSFIFISLFSYEFCGICVVKKKYISGVNVPYIISDKLAACETFCRWNNYTGRQRSTVGNRNHV